MTALARSGALVSLALLLSGCCSGVTSDPREGGLAGGVCGQATGAYGQRIDDRTALLASLDGSRRALEGDLSGLDAKADALLSALRGERRSLERQRRDLAGLSRDLAAMTAASPRRAALVEEIGALDRQVADALAANAGRERSARALRSGASSAIDAGIVERSIAEAGRRQRERDAEMARIRNALGV
ncbi:hypothetical protein DYI37_08035 [Fulvimarina endophytica]|uniref:Uncharacterized protein n=1 Tax=Fulvimarina endophytica TaxID=2293836 RepID=A0A371X4X0_9HYPH|nr:hypothetical protein [Fulvimarina endophytica]RFC64278.1 hypothetical protein DYI37_08035 [Fulvimarina endophytica]